MLLKQFIHCHTKHLYLKEKQLEWVSFNNVNATRRQTAFVTP
jgi:hypothetical protein